MYHSCTHAHSMHTAVTTKQLSKQTNNTDLATGVCEQQLC